MFEHDGFHNSFNRLPFNRIQVVAPAPDLPVGEPNDLTFIYDTDVVPLEYLGEQQAYAQSPWTAHDGLAPCQWLLTREMNMYMAGNDGYVYKFGKGTTDSGRKIDSYYVTDAIDLGAPDRRKRLRWIDIDADSIPDSFVRVHYKIDEGDWRLLCEIEQGNFKYPFVAFPKPAFRKITLKFSSGYVGCTFRINGFALDMVIHGQQKEMIK